MFVAAVGTFDDVIATHGIVEESHKLLVALMAIHDCFGFFVVGQVIHLRSLPQLSHGAANLVPNGPGSLHDRLSPVVEVAGYSGAA